MFWGGDMAAHIHTNWWWYKLKLSSAVGLGQFMLVSNVEREKGGSFFIVVG